MIINKIATMLTVNNEAADKIMIALKDSGLVLERPKLTEIYLYEILEEEKPVTKEDNEKCCANCGHFQNGKKKEDNPCEPCDNYSEFIYKDCSTCKHDNCCTKDCENHNKWEMEIKASGIAPDKEEKTCKNCAYGIWKRQKGRKKHSMCSDCVDNDEWQPMKKIKSEDY